jgi:hypothetical protein
VCFDRRANQQEIDAGLGLPRTVFDIFDGGECSSRLDDRWCDASHGASGGLAWRDFVSRMVSNLKFLLSWWSTEGSVLAKIFVAHSF